MEKNLNPSNKLTKEEFLKLLKMYSDQEERLKKLSDAGLRIWDTEIIEYGNLLFDKLIKTFFTQEGEEWISWWLYEKDGNPDMKAWDEDNDEIPMETAEDFWRYVKQYRK